MARRLLIIPSTAKPSEYKDLAYNQACPEIAVGIPTGVKVMVPTLTEKQLPYVHVEPEPLPMPPPRDALAELDDLNARLTEKGIL